jgi:hypothetical protein
MSSVPRRRSAVRMRRLIRLVLFRLSWSVSRVWRPAGPSVGCLTRVYKGELPYLKSWLLHYAQLGVSHFYLIHTKDDTSEEAELLSVIRDCDVSFTLLRKPNGEDSDACFNSFVPVFKEQYLLHVDVDEFLLLESATLREYIQGHPAQYYRFQWVMCPYDRDGKPAHLAGSFQRDFKSMAETRLIQSIEPHVMICEGGDRVVTHEGGSALIHYWGRSFTDILIKCLHGNELSPEKASSLEELTKCARLGRIPNRLKMLAVLSRRASPDVLRPNFVEPDSDSELRLVTELTQEQRAELFDAYSHYRDNLTDEVVEASFKMTLIEYVGHMP